MRERAVSAHDDNNVYMYTATTIQKLCLVEHQRDKEMISKEPKMQRVMVEMKARIDDLDDVRTRLLESGATRIGVFHQMDTYYHVPKGRLKLRETRGKTAAQLVYYERENVAGAKRSTVFLVTIPSPQEFRRLAEQVLETRGVIEKSREIYLHERTQVHLDTVSNLGFFVEFERVTLDDSEAQEDDLKRLEELRAKLHIDRRSLEKDSYIDLL